MDTLESLLAREACRELVLRAAAAADANDPAALASLFTDDAVLVRPNAEPLRGREAIRQAYAQRAPDRITRHLVSNSLVTALSPLEASVRSLVLLWTGQGSDEAGPQGRPAHARQLVGEFDDELRLTAEGWRIARRVARFVLHTPD